MQTEPINVYRIYCVLYSCSHRYWLGCVTRRIAFLTHARSVLSHMILRNYYYNIEEMSGGGGEVGGEGEGEDGASESSADLSGQLIRASKDGDLGKVKYLVEVEHVDPHSCRDSEYDATPLHWASIYGHLDIVRYLVEEQQCDVECRDKYGGTPLHCAALGGRLDIVQYLISERGCDPMCRGQYGSTPLHHACQEGKLNVVKYLVEDVKVELSCRDEYDATPLHSTWPHSVDICQ